MSVHDVCVAFASVVEEDFVSGVGMLLGEDGEAWVGHAVVEGTGGSFVVFPLEEVFVINQVYYGIHGIAFILIFGIFRTIRLKGHVVLCMSHVHKTS